MIDFGKNKNSIKIIAGLLIILSGTILILSILNTNKLRDELAEKQLQMLIEKTQTETKTFYKELNTSLKTISGLISSGILEDSEINKWSKGILPVLQSNLNVTAFSLANNEGSEFYVSLEDSVLNYYFFKDGNEKRTIYYSLNLKTNLLQKSDVVIGTRAIDLASYKNRNLINSDTIHWFGFQAIPGVNKLAGNAATLKTIDNTSGEEIILSIYVSTFRLYDFMKANAELVHGDLFLFTGNMEFFDFNNENRDKTSASLSNYLVDVEEIRNPLYKMAMEIGWNLDISDSVTVESFMFNKRKYWGAFKKTERANDLKIALIIPEDDFFVVLKGRLGFLFFSSVFVLLVAVALFMYAVFRSRNNETSNKAHTIDEIFRLIQNGENEFAEFKSTIRMNLFSKKPGKEIELAWLKSVVAFCNTKGGTILIGVNDEGEILGLDADNFKNDDKCLLHVQSLLKDHIGMEFTKYINYKLHIADNKKLLAVHCSPSPQPLFLIANNKEQFYVRSGPASIELPTSKAIKYIEDKKKNAD